MKLGQKLKEARTQAGLSQDAVAKTIGVSRQSISNWENDRTYPDIGSLLKLSDLYGLSLDGMLKEDETIPAHFENLAARRKTFCQVLLEVGTVLSIIALMTLGMDFPVATTWLLVLSSVLVYLAYIGHLRYFDHSPTEVRRGYCGLAIMIGCNILAAIFPGMGNNLLLRVIHLAGVCLLWQSGVYKMFWKSPRVLVYVALMFVIPVLSLMMNLRDAGGMVANHPFNFTYRVSQVLYDRDGDTAEDSQVRLYNVLGIEFHMRLTGSDGSSLGFEEECVYSEPLPGQTEQAVWQLIPESDPDTLYRIALEADDSVTLSCTQGGELEYKWLLTRAETCTVTISTPGRNVFQRPDWYPAGSPDPEPNFRATDVAGTATLTVTLSGLEAETMTLTEEYHHGDSVEYTELTLEPAERYGYTIELSTRYDGVEEYALYRLAFDGGEYRFTITYGK